ncbi:uncharacterized protein LOC129244988 isoform X1 [Anastrepha obliqua]|uniref:uncharacterized protein LOC129244988 isoform X1 n=1 Tax=Anastrepha obliqua TaxID=95512 RepID=UPI00240900B9|nr:uncharacterized protein LOC129244988 isoform X1 [Anastrepha obliqua]
MSVFHPMDKLNFRLLAGLVLSLSLSQHTCRCQPNALFNQSPFQRQQQTQLRQQLQQQQQQQHQQRQQQQGFPNSLNTLQPVGAISPISQLSGIVPQSPFRIYNRLDQPNYVPITAYQNDLNYDGSFSYGYASADGTTAQAQGYVKNLGLGEDVEAQVVQGSYSYTSPEGTPITVRYIADENGFRAEGAHIPTPPPIPDAIAKSLQYIASVQQPYQQAINPNLNPYQTPFRQFSGQQRPGQQQQLTPFQLQQQQQRAYQQQLAGQLQPPFPQFPGAQQPQSNAFYGGGLGGGLPGQGQLPGQFGDLSGQNFTQQPQNLQQEQQQQVLQQQQKNQQQQQHQQQQQQQLATQELRARPNQLVNPFGYNQYRRYKKAALTKN